ncbi:MAG TPA: methionyl-tRNA formyltransferase [Clostridiales bacterium]|nr:methionyl-tRNA formyltransferase [Clostridiales bacterium]
MNIVFMGTPQFAVSSLQKLHENGHNIKLVITQPDKPFGRGKKIKKSEVKEKAEELGLEVFQPLKIKTEDSVNVIKNLNPDLIVVIAYGQILSKDILDIPKFGCINVHASLLPKLRGAAPINWSIINGDEKTGVTTMLMDVGLDTGDMLLKEEVEITENMTAGELHDILSEVGSELLINTINKIEDKTIVRVKQDHSISTYAPLLKKETSLINWNESAKNVHNMVRGLNPDQIAYFIYDDKNVKVYKTTYNNDVCKHEPGTVIRADKTGIYVVTSDGIIIIRALQMPGKNKMSIEDYLRGNNFPEMIKL